MVTVNLTVQQSGAVAAAGGFSTRGRYAGITSDAGRRGHRRVPASAGHMYRRVPLAESSACNFRAQSYRRATNSWKSSFLPHGLVIFSKESAVAGQ